MKFTMKRHAKILQQKGRRISVQLQKSVDKEIGPLLAKGYIEKEHKSRDNVFMQVTVKTVKNKPGTAKVGAISKAQNLKGGPFGLCETPAVCKKIFKK